ncbi:hemerythrin HHE cation binding domain-containing protein [Mariannaea sp. PMI_226]|nr:hemerythrin HHE cation binding domain-containing protein [Mariannaea sp. PMI_226]
MAPVYADHPFALILTPAHQEDDPDIFSNVASEMALVHNMIIRGLNSIYLQAPHVQSKDISSFQRYCMAWYDLLHVHHSGEESQFFPYVETATGKKGIMEKNIQQHEAFHEGLETFKSYIQECISGKVKFDSAKIITIIDEFGETLTQHLREEIPTILGLREYGEDKFSTIKQVFDAEGEDSMKKLGLVAGLPFCFGNHDVNYEDGKWAKWPPAPMAVHLLSRHVTFWAHRDAWKFCACDRLGQMRPLYAV